MEAAATATPTVLVPGSFGGRHQLGNAEAMVEAGAALVLQESDLGSLGEVLTGLLADVERRQRMGTAALSAVKPGAAAKIASAMLESTYAGSR